MKSVLLFSNHGWRDLEGKTIGVTDDTATSVLLLKVLLERKYSLKARIVRMHSGVNDHSEYDAVLLIGDEALRQSRSGGAGFEIIYDLAREWYEWQKLPFVFAVWAIRKALGPASLAELSELIGQALEKGEGALEEVGALHAHRIGLTKAESSDYLRGFNYRLGERELKAIEVFESYITQKEEPIPQSI